MKSIILSILTLLSLLSFPFSASANKEVQDKAAKMVAHTANDIETIGIEGHFGTRGSSDAFFPEDYNYVGSLVIANPEVLPTGGIRRALGKVKVWGTVSKGGRELTIGSIVATEKCEFFYKYKSGPDISESVSEAMKSLSNAWMKALEEANISCPYED